MVCFPDAEHQARIVETLAVKYRGKIFDLLLPTGLPALQFTIANVLKVWPRAPIVFAAVDGQQLERASLPANVTGAGVSMLERSPLDLIRRLQPDLQTLVLVSGSSAFERYWLEQDRRRVESEAPQLKVIVYSDLPPPGLQRRLSALPPRSAVFNRFFFKDATGRFITRTEATKIITDASSAPVYGAFAADLGQGIVGGYLISLDDSARMAARIALDVLRDGTGLEGGTGETGSRGAAADSRILQKRFGLPTQSSLNGKFMVDCANSSVGAQ